MWADVKNIIKNWKQDQIIKKKNECKSWWNDLKNELQESIKVKIVK